MDVILLTAENFLALPTLCGNPMPISRRRMIGGALAATAGLGTAFDLNRAGAAETDAAAAPAESSPGDVVSKGIGRSTVENPPAVTSTPAPRNPSAPDISALCRTRNGSLLRTLPTPGHSSSCRLDVGKPEIGQPPSGGGGSS
ncbi:hypothetical protein [Streptomyces sp. PRh5]|uniref:hypothetical protein n=1 Tax=Streptomyces sp. PRh5 TaxID=1158056 RepID=UPI0012FEAA74|nr:hypothetical protein [Streptomyces sp. PRh5]